MQTMTTWPSIPLAAWRETATALHLWLQIAGKARLALTPWINHGWHATFYITQRGLTSSPIAHGKRSFQIDFDFIQHRVCLTTSDDAQRELPLKPQSVADFYTALMSALDELGLQVKINTRPNEVPDPIPFYQDTAPREYDAEAVHRFWLALVQIDRVFKHFRTGFLGKVSPVHLFWGVMDLAVTRFSGRRAPLHPGGFPGLPDSITREAYSHEVSSAGFWAGGGGIDEPAFYSYAYPEPDGFREAAVQPAGAYYDASLREFLLPYDAVRNADDPDATLLAFLQSTYNAAADLGKWNRAELECPLGQPQIPRLL